MAGRIINLWRANEDAARLYRVYLARLQMNGRHESVVSACRQIRRYADRGPGRNEGSFTFWFEIDSLCELKNYQTAWRQLHLREKTASGRPLDITRRKWSAEDTWELAFSYAPLLYFLGRYRLGCELLETSLGFYFGRKDVQSYDILFHVFNPDDEPRNRARVTLTHFYRRLGKSLNEWQHWQEFVNGFPPRLFQMTRVKGEELLANSDKLPGFVRSLIEVIEARTTSGVTRGQTDLLESPAKVRKWQEATRMKLERLRSDPTREHFNASLQRLFPDLALLPR